MTDRNRHLSSDQLLSPELHPAGSRLILSRGNISNQVEPYEVTILEWAPSGKRVKLSSLHRPEPRWTECWHYTPVVIEELPPAPFTVDGSFSPERFADHFAKSLLEFGKTDKAHPENAVTLWRQIVEGIERVADRLTAPLER